jgi:hypothetical protein
MSHDYVHFKRKAGVIIEKAFHGEHHVKSLKWNDFPWCSCSFLVFGNLATWDDSKLTWLVVLCHDLCLRAEVSNGGPHMTKVTLWPRLRNSEEAPISEACPTLEDHIARIRGEIDTHELQRRMKP